MQKVKVQTDRDRQTDRQTYEAGKVVPLHVSLSPTSFPFYAPSITNVSSLPEWPLIHSNPIPLSPPSALPNHQTNYLICFPSPPKPSSLPIITYITYPSPILLTTTTTTTTRSFSHTSANSFVS